MVFFLENEMVKGVKKQQGFTAAEEQLLAVRSFFTFFFVKIQKKRKTK